MKRGSYSHKAMSDFMDALQELTESGADLDRIHDAVMTPQLLAALIMDGAAHALRSTPEGGATTLIRLAASMVIAASAIRMTVDQLRIEEDAADRIAENGLS